jgi:uncharacterized YigZ family protein
LSAPEFYNTIDQTAQAEFKDRGSRFIAFVYPVKDVNDFKQYLQSLKKEHPKAVHHCFAYRLGLNKDNFRVSDDGEPSGTAGKPILNQIDSKELTNVAIIVVRYFGGTLLGVPGLITAYKSASSMALQLVPFIQKPVTKSCRITFDYTQMNEIMRWVKAFNVEVASQEMQLFCSMNVNVPVRSFSEFSQMIHDLRDVELIELKN